MTSLASPVLRTVYIDELVDQELTTQSQLQGRPKAVLFRLWLSMGMRAVRRGRMLRSPVPPPTSPLVLKTVQLNPEVDRLIRAEAFDEHMSQNDVVRQYVSIGLALSKDASRMTGSGSRPQ